MTDLSPAPAVRNRPRSLVATGLPLVLLGLLSACSSGTSTTASSSAATSAAAPTSASASASASGASGSELTGTVGEGDAFVISLVDSSGAPVTSLKAGAYTVKVKDASKIHDFHLTGPGVEKTTTVPEVTDVTWSVNLTAGSYTFKCDPHAKMTGTFTVT